MQQRLFEITLLLMQQGGATAGELARRFEVSKRTIYRDVDALSGAGIPVYAEQGKGGGIRMLPDFVLEKNLFSKQEQQLIIAQLEGLSSIGTPGTQSALQKLASVFGQSESWLEVDYAPWGADARHGALFGTLRDAILQKQIVHFSYTSAVGQASLRTVEPLRIVFRGQGWYLYGFSQERQDFRYFKLTRIGKFEVTTAHFTRTLPKGQRTASVYEGPVAELRLRFQPSAAYRVIDEFPAGQITEEAQGYLVTCRLPHDEWLPGYLLSFGAQVEVLSPHWLRKEMRVRLQEALNIYL